MTKKKEKELKKYIEEILQNAYLKSPAGEYKYAYQSGMYEAALKWILKQLSDK